MSEKQFYLLQVNDALFPIGGYSHSQGLETYIQRGIVQLQHFFLCLNSMDFLKQTSIGSL